MPTTSGSAHGRARIGALAACALLLASGADAPAQNRYEWTVYSALNSVQSVAFDSSGTVWAATTGGVVGYHVAEDTFEVFRTTEGLMSLNTSAVGVAPNGDLYAGGADGSLSIRSRDGAWHGIGDIANVDRSDRRILGFSFHGARAYVLTAFGVAVFNPADSTFPETWTRFRDLPPNIPVNDILFWRDSIWLATDRGIARAPASGVLLPNPLSWTIIGRGEGLAGERVHSLAVVDDRLHAGTDSGAYVRNDDGRFARRGDINGSEPVRYAMSGVGVAATARYALFRYQSGAFRSTDVASPVDVRDISMGSDGTIAVAAGDLGIGILEGAALRIVAPSAPTSNTFGDLALGQDGSIWTANGDWGRGSGVSRLHNGIWEQYTPALYPQSMPKGNVMNVGVGGDGAIWAGTWETGALRIDPADSGATIENFTNVNSPFTGIQGAPGFIIAGDAVGDLRGRTWMTNWDNTDGSIQSALEPMLVVRLTPDEAAAHGTPFRSFLQPVGTSHRIYRWLAIDQNGTKWLGSDRPSPTTPYGLLFFNENGTLDVEQDDDTGFLSTVHGLVSNQNTALAVDLDGAVWIGAPTGLSVLDNPMTVASQGAEAARIRSSEPDPGNCCRALRDVSVTALAVDALNRKWVGTNQGIFVLSPDGIDVVARFTVENSPLVDNNVESILAVHETGDVYIGTQNGLNRVSTDAVESPEPSSGLTVAPQPFVIPGDETVRIAGLPPNAQVKILTTSGRLIAQFDSPGGAVAFWDGRDGAGDLAPTGVYIVAAGAASGGETVIGKIAVIRR